MRYVNSDPLSPAGLLIPRRRAPCCQRCGRRLWTPIWKDKGWPQNNKQGERLGYVPELGGSGPEPRCRNSLLCAKRKAAQAAGGK